MREAEPLHATQQDGYRDVVPLVEIEQCVGDGLPPAALALAEVRRQLQTVLVHQCTPIQRPSAAAATPIAKLATTLTAAGRCWRSSPSRCVSNIQVENVV